MSQPRHPKAKLKWPVEIKTDERSIDGVTLDINPNGVFISCPKPLRLNETFDMTITDSDSGRSVIAKAEVVWSNIYGPDDEITPRGMRARFLNVSGEDRRFLAKLVQDQLSPEEAEFDKVKSLNTLEFGVDQIHSGAAER